MRLECDRLTLRAVEGEDAEAAAAGDAVGGEIGVVHGEDGGDGFAFGEVDQGCVGEIHGVVGVAGHEVVEARQFVLGNSSEGEGAGANERPGGFGFPGFLPEEVEKFGENRLRGKKWEAELLEGIGAEMVPAVVAVDDGQDCAGVG